MGYQGYLVKVGEYTIPYKFINSETYIGNRNIQDLDSHRDANGELHRNALSHVPCKVDFKTPPNITSAEFAELMSNIQANYINKLERKANVTAFIPEINDYITQNMYMPDITPTIIGELNGELLYSPIRLAFIGY